MKARSRALCGVLSGRSPSIRWSVDAIVPRHSHFMEEIVRPEKPIAVDLLTVSKFRERASGGGRFVRRHGPM